MPPIRRDLPVLWTLLSWSCAAQAPPASETRASLLPAPLVEANRPIPEHLRSLEDVFFTDSGRQRNPQIIVGPLSDAMPAYTRFLLFSQRPDAAQLPFLQDRQHQVFADALPKVSREQAQFWAQDSMRVLARPDGSATLLLPRGESLLPEIRQQLQEAGYDLRISELAWEGGNLAYDHFQGQGLVFMGYTIYEGQSSRAENPGLALEEVQRILAAELEADQVVPIPYVTGNLFHLDQIFMITAPGQVVVHSVRTEQAQEEIHWYTREPGNYFYRTFLESDAAQDCTAESQDPRACQERYAQNLPQIRSHALRHAQKMHDRLDQVAAVFAQLDYEVHRLEADLRLLWDHLSLVNGLPFQHRELDQPAVILPEYIHHGRAAYADMRRADELFQSLGFQASFAPMDTVAGGGGPHCVTSPGR